MSFLKSSASDRQNYYDQLVDYKESTIIIKNLVAIFDNSSREEQDSKDERLTSYMVLIKLLLIYRFRL